MFKIIVFILFISFLIFNFFRSIMDENCNGFKVCKDVFMILAFCGICGWI